ncbi:MAG: hypothetical protein PUI10_04635 [Prevotellaceae bacterium]|nr:hypothetical protein [Prevotellaceae bacterium]
MTANRVVARLYRSLVSICHVHLLYIRFLEIQQASLRKNGKYKVIK